MAPNYEELINCAICQSEVEDALQLPCFHVFCKKCLEAQVEDTKLICHICKSEHKVIGTVDKVFKPSAMTKFWINWNDERFDKVKPSEDEKIEVEGLCEECSPKQAQQSRPKTSTTGKNQVQPEPVLLKLKVCSHCKKKLCENCRNKHYNNQRQEAFKILENFQDGSWNLVVVSENLNGARLKKIAEYEKLKSEIAQKRIELSKKLETEEKSLITRLEAEIKEERQNMEQSSHDIKKFTATKEITRSIREKLMVEKDMKVLSEICNEFSKSQGELKTQLTSEAQRIDPNKERKLVFTPTKLKEDIIGVLEQKKGNLKLKQADIPDSGKSKICTIM